MKYYGKTLGILPKEIIYKLMTYLDMTNYFNISRISHYYHILNLPRFSIEKRLRYNFTGEADFLSDWVNIYYEEIGYREYLEDIYYSIFLENLEVTKKSTWSSIIFDRKPFDFRNFRKIIYHNEFKKEYLSQIQKKVKIHSVFRIDMISYMHLKRKYKHILALIY